MVLHRLYYSTNHKLTSTSFLFSYPQFDNGILLEKPFFALFTFSYALRIVTSIVLITLMLIAFRSWKQKHVTKFHLVHENLAFQYVTTYVHYYEYHVLA